MEIELNSFLSSLRASESVLGILLIAGAVLLFRVTTFKESLQHIPVVGEELGGPKKRAQAYVLDGPAILTQGYNKFKSIWRLTTPEGDHVIVPPHLLDEIKNKKEDEVDNIAALDALTERKLTGIESTSPMMNHLVKGDLTSSLNRINPRLALVAEEAVQSEFPPCEDWTPVVFHAALLRVIAIVSGNIFLGPELCRNEEYMDLSIQYTINAFSGIFRLKTWQKWLRPIGVFFVPEMKTVKGHRERVRKFLVPIIRERKAAMSKPGYEAPDDLLQWSLNKAPKFEDEIKTDDDLAIMQLRLSLAAIHTTSTTSIILMNDILSQPGLIKVLREEMEVVLAAHGGTFSTKALYEMKLLDSVMKESQRLHMLGPVNFHTYAKRGIKLSDGSYIPPNTFLETSSQAIARDPANFPNPDTFDPYRFYNLRRSSGEEAGRHQFVTLSKDVIAFGYGRHACPGRFFAANEIKLIMISIFRSFDVEMKGQEMVFRRIKK